VTRPQILIALALSSLLVAAVTPFLGAPPIAVGVLFDAPDSETGRVDPDQFILREIRIPRVALAFLAGASLALCGMAFQSMFRNPLATPFTLGVSSGASLGALIALRLGLTTAVLGVSMVTVGAFLGALMAISLVYGLTRMRGGFSTSTMLLAGVAVSFFFSSLILFIQYTADIYDSFRLMRWLMGGIASATGYSAVVSALLFAIPGGLVVFYCTHELNLLATGDDIAASRGVDVRKTKVILFVATSLTVGGVVAQCGPIAFVGMMAPHICRILIGPDHRYLAPATCLFGGAFLAACDTFARIALAPAELPVGVVTAFLGGPFFLWLLMRGEADRNLH
jgi:iron complex transport system permease protein